MFLTYHASFYGIWNAELVHSLMINPHCKLCTYNYDLGIKNLFINCVFLTWRYNIGRLRFGEERTI